MGQVPSQRNNKSTYGVSMRSGGDNDIVTMDQASQLATVATGSATDKISTVNSSTATLPYLSLFERLAPEVRNLIYNCHFGEGSQLHITRKYVHDPIHRCRNSEYIRNLTHILLVNKRIHTEAKSILFHKREFTFPTVTCLAFFAHSVALADRKLVRYISFDYSGVYAPRAFVALARFPAIETLKVVFSKTNVYRESWHNRTLQVIPGHREFMKLRGIGIVEVVIALRLHCTVNCVTVAKFRDEVKVLNGPWVDPGEKTERKGPLKAKMGRIEA